MARRAFGAQRPMTAEQKARNVGQSILLHEAEGHPWTFQQYGVTPDSPQAQLVQAWLDTHTPEAVE